MKSVVMIVLATCLSALAQVNILADVINFRAPGSEHETTTHYGRLELTGSTSDAVVDATNTLEGAAHISHAVRGTNMAGGMWTHGGHFESRHIGVVGYASNPAGPNESLQKIGGHFTARGSGDMNVGLWANAYGNEVGANEYAVGLIATAEGATGWNNIAAYYCGRTVEGGAIYPSDRRLKEHVRPMEGALEKIARLNPVVYRYTSDARAAFQSDAGEMFGMVAQEVESVLPELVEDFPLIRRQTVGGRGDSLAVQGVYKGIQYDRLIPLLVRAVQEQQKQIEDLKSELRFNR